MADDKQDKKIAEELKRLAKNKAAKEAMRPKRTRCESCNEDFESPGKLLNHIRRVHS